MIETKSSQTARPGYYTPSFTAGMLAQLRHVGEPFWSPNGRYLFYPQDFDARTDIMRLDLQTGQTLQVTTDVEAGGLLKIAMSGRDISPDGKQLVYLSGKDGKLWLIPAGGGVARRLTPHVEGTQHSSVFSPDGSKVAYIAAFGDNQDIAVVSSDGEGWPSRVSRGEHFVFDPQWIPGGERLVYGEHDNMRMAFYETRLVMADLKSGELKTLVDGWGKNTVYSAPRPSPDGRWLAYVSNESGWNNVYILNLESGNTRPLAPGEVEQGEPTWSPDGKGLIYTVNQHCSIGLSFTSLEGQTIVIEQGDGICEGSSFAPDGKRLAYLKQSEVSPPNIYLYDFAERQSRPITAVEVGGMEQAGLVKAEVVHWTSPDGLEIEGLLYVPNEVQPGKHPLLLHIHGGPIAQYNRRWDASVQHWVSRGWVVIEPNFRGSTGYGREFRDKLRGTWGHEDMLDNIGAIDYAQQRGLIDPTKVVAWGGSGGGYATNLLLGKWPERFKAGVSLVGVSNFVSFPEQTDRIARPLIEELLGSRHENFELYGERSPVSFAQHIKAPLMIIMGAEDRRVPAIQGEEMVEALKKAGKTDFEYISYEGEGHGWRKVATLLDHHQHMYEFLKKWVLER
ncbi:MAG TPA: S9 family peptidase [Chloroflexia bacterium]|nr:S9 family peptidase [Chloroflexia bacterium]